MPTKEGVFVTIHQTCDGGRGRKRTVNANTYSFPAGFYTSEQAIHALERVYGTYRI
jgi:hypothetical protein